MLTAIGDVMRRVYERGWITTRDGNISMRKREGKYLYITPSGWRKTIVHPEHVVRIEIVKEAKTGELIPKVREGQQPSGELWMHWNLQRDGKKPERSCMSTPHISWPPCMPASICRLSAQNSPRSRAIPEWDRLCPRCRPCHVNWRTRRLNVSVLAKTGRWPSISWDRPTTASAPSRRTHGPPMNISNASTTFARLSSKAV